MEGQAGRERAEAQAPKAPVVTDWEARACELTLLSGRDLICAALQLGREMADARSREVAEKCVDAARIYREAADDGLGDPLRWMAIADGIEEGAKLALSKAWLKS